MTVSIAILFVSFFGVLSVFLLYPLSTYLVAALTGRTEPQAETELPSVSVLVVVRNGATLIADKIENALTLDYPGDLLEVVVFSDGSTDETAAVIENCAQNGRVRPIVSEEHVGKTAGINRSVPMCKGDVIVFSDADALLEKSAVRYLVRAFDDPSVGGVCGQRVISGDRAKLKDAQRRFIRFDSWIKKLESEIGSISSNDGKIYAVRKNLFRPIAQAVTDDFYTCLSIVKQGYRFVFEQRAMASIRVPSRDAAHELQRRRRIVCRSLRGVYLMRELLNPARHGFYSVSLFFNKVVRRALPVLFALIFLSSMSLVTYLPIAWPILAVELAFLLLAGGYPILSKTGPKPLRKLSSTAFYFCLGNLGTLLGVVDFLRGRKVVQWNPVKEDAH